jgi:hypothetical protein
MILIDCHPNWKEICTVDIQGTWHFFLNLNLVKLFDGGEKTFIVIKISYDAVVGSNEISDTRVNAQAATDQAEAARVAWYESKQSSQWWAVLLGGNVVSNRTVSD